MANSPPDNDNADISALVLAEFNKMKERSLPYLIRRVIRDRIEGEIDAVMKEKKADIRAIVETELMSAISAAAKVP